LHGVGWPERRGYPLIGKCIKIFVVAALCLSGLLIALVTINNHRYSEILLDQHTLEKEWAVYDLAMAEFGVLLRRGSRWVLKVNDAQAITASPDDPVFVPVEIPIRDQNFSADACIGKPVFVMVRVNKLWSYTEISQVSLMMVDSGLERDGASVCYNAPAVPMLERIPGAERK